MVRKTLKGKLIFSGIFAAAVLFIGIIMEISVKWVLIIAVATFILAFLSRTDAAERWRENSERRAEEHRARREHLRHAREEEYERERGRIEAKEDHEYERKKPFGEAPFGGPGLFGGSGKKGRKIKIRI